MKLFIKKIILYLLPLLAMSAISEYLLRIIPNDYNKKATIFRRDPEKIKALILGSSYGLYDLNPDYFKQYTFNGCEALQSLDLDKKIFDKYQGRMTNLEYVIMPISFASFFFKLETSKENHLVKNYCLYYNLHATNDLTNYFELLNQPFSVNRKRLVDYYINHIQDVKITDRGFDSTYNTRQTNRQLVGPTASFAIKQLNITDFSKYKELRRCLEDIIVKCKARNIGVILLTPPAYKTFYSLADTAELNSSIRTCQSIQQDFSNVKYFNFLEDTDFTIDDFFDLSHLNKVGAKKLSEKINAVIENNNSDLLK
jgi:hypothetical protein